MKKRILIFALISMIFLATPLYPVSFNGKKILKQIWMGKEIEYVEGEILFKMKPKVKLKELELLFSRNKAKLVERPDRLGIGRLELSDPVDVFQVIKNLNSSDLIEFAVPNMIDRAMFPPYDPYFGDGTQWGLYNYGQIPPGGIPGADISALDSWEISTGSSDILIAILDSGIPMWGDFLVHPDLNNTSRYVLGQDIVGDGEWVKDNYGHGTHVLGIIAARTNNGEGVAGVDWECRVLIDQVFDGSGIGTHNTFKNGVLHAVDYGARAINYSGGGLSSPIKEQAVGYADSNDVVLVCAAGNDFGDSVIYPAHYADDYLNVIAVSATTCEDQLSPYSNYGPSICVAAPGGGGMPWDGDDIFSTTPNYWVTLNEDPYSLTEYYGYMAGTSMSCGMVTGLASLLLSIEPNLTAHELREIIEESADQVGDYMYYIETGKSMELGHGRINCYTALVLTSTEYTYVYGDADGDDIVTLGDLLFVLNYVFKNGPAPDPLSAGDPNGDCIIDMADMLSLTNYLYRSGPAPLRGCVEE